MKKLFLYFLKNPIIIVNIFIAIYFIRDASFWQLIGFTVNGNQDIIPLFPNIVMCLLLVITTILYVVIIDALFPNFRHKSFFGYPKIISTLAFDLLYIFIIWVVAIQIISGSFF